MDQVLVTFEKNKAEQVRVILSDFKGRKVLNIRVFEPNPAGDWLPTRKGLAFEADKLYILLAALHKAARELDEITGWPYNDANES